MILRPGHNVWRIERAARAAVILDGAPYFGAVRTALLNARHRAVIAGWDIHSRTRLVGPEGHANDGLPETLAEFLSALVERRPQLEISLLLWDYAVLYAAERELFPTYTLRWNTPPNIKLCLDDEVPIGSSQHQKLVVIDDTIAFTGGLDITVRRWDTSDHRADNPQRRDPADRPYEPFHDVQMLLDGEAARALAALARTRWEYAAHEPLPPIETSHDPWPESVKPDFANIAVGIARTQPRFEQQAELREVEALFLDSVAAAERTIYIENQFLSWVRIAEAIATRLGERPQLEVLIVGPATHASWIEARSMRNGQIRFMQILRDSGHANRIRVVSPVVRQDSRTAHTMVHAKVMIVDDVLLHVGSANLNNRSMGTDTECDVAIEAGSEAERAGIAAVRSRLIADHCGVSVDDVAAAFAEHGSLLALADRLSANGHSLQPIDDGPPDHNDWAAYLEGIADPEEPIGAEAFAEKFLGGEVPQRTLSNVIKVAASGVLVLALVLAWQFTPLAPLTHPDRVRAALQTFSEGPWGPLMVLGAFVGVSLLFFPITVLIAATAAAFGPLLGFVYAATGSLISALITFAIGARVGREALNNVLGPRLNRVRNKISRRGLIAVALIRLVPIAPFGIINLVAGASRIRLSDFVMGTALGMVPGIVAMAAVGHQIARMITEPSLDAFAWLTLAMLGWIALSIGLQALVSKFGSRS